MSHMETVEKECEQLKRDIARLGTPGPGHGLPVVSFGKLFEDEQCQQFYEALNGTLKAARKRGIIDIKGQMWLKGAHDKVPITLLDAKPPAPASARAGAPAPPPPPAAPAFTHHTGYMPTGNDVHSAEMSVADAQKWCIANPQAAGFTFEGHTFACSTFAALTAAITFCSQDLMVSRLVMQ